MLYKIARSRERILLVAAAAACLAPPSDAEAASIVLSGDSTPAFSLSPIDENQGTRRFFRNVLGDGTTVAVTRSSPYNGADFEITDFYGSLRGVSAERVTDSLSGETLMGVDLLVVPPPTEGFAPSEIDAILGMLASGGSLFAMGEASANSIQEIQNANINALMSAIGSDLSLTSASLDIGTQVASAAQLESHELTEGVSELIYGATSITNGGTVLLRTKDGSPMATVDPTLVPEPSTGLLCAMGIVALVGSRPGRVRPLRGRTDHGRPLGVRRRQ